MWNRLLTPVFALAPLSTACVTAAEGAEEAPQAEPFRVLLLGDSISIGYTPFVQEALAERARVLRPTRGDAGERPENCAGTNNGVRHLERWLALDGGDWDVIHFNFGLHDLKRVDPVTGANSNDPDHPHQASPERYGAQLRAIVTRLQETEARLVFATTTPVPEGELRPHREPADAVAYNRVASKVMMEKGVRVNDLFRFVMSHEEPLLRGGDVHFAKEGSKALGKRVAESILEAAGLAREVPVGR